MNGLYWIGSGMHLMESSDKMDKPGVIKFLKECQVIVCFLFLKFHLSKRFDALKILQSKSLPSDFI